MSEQTTDRRIIRTKRMIRNAFSELIEEKGFEAITVRDITTKADINRGTFYLHYRDKYDLLEQSEDEIIQEIEEITNEVKVEDLLTFGVQREPLPYLIKLFEYLKENASFMKAILGPKGDPAFQIKLKDFIKNKFLKKFLLNQLEEEKMLVPKEYFTAYISSAHLGVIQHWLERGTVESPREMGLIILTITLMGPIQAVGLKNETKS